MRTPAGAAPGLPEEPERYNGQGSVATDGVVVFYDDYKELRTFALLAVTERDEAWAAVRDATLGLHEGKELANWAVKHAATIAAAAGECCCTIHHPNNGRCLQCPIHGMQPREVGNERSISK